MAYSYFLIPLLYHIILYKMGIYTICLAMLELAFLNQQETVQACPVYSAEKSEVRFYSHAPLEDIEASSIRLRAAMDIESGKLLFIVPVNSFEFEKKLMQKHFNEQYLESDKYPEARFEGRFVEAPVEIDGSGEFGFEGLLTIHGTGHQIKGIARLEQAGETIYGESHIQVRLEDYRIRIPRMVIKNIAEVVDVSISVQFSRTSNN